MLAARVLGEMLCAKHLVTGTQMPLDGSGIPLPLTPFSSISPFLQGWHGTEHGSGRGRIVSTGESLKVVLSGQLLRGLV